MSDKSKAQRLMDTVDEAIECIEMEVYDRDILQRLRALSERLDTEPGELGLELVDSDPDVEWSALCRQHTRTVHVVCAGEGPHLEFVGVETPEGRSVRVGHWRELRGMKHLVLTVLAEEVHGE